MTIPDMDTVESRKGYILTHEEQYIKRVLTTLGLFCESALPEIQFIRKERMSQLEAMLNMACTRYESGKGSQPSNDEIDTLFNGMYTEKRIGMYGYDFLSASKEIIGARIGFYYGLLSAEGHASTWQELIRLNYPTIDDYFGAFEGENLALHRISLLIKDEEQVPADAQHFHEVELEGISEARKVMGFDIYEVRTLSS